VPYPAWTISDSMETHEDEFVDTYKFSDDEKRSSENDPLSLDDVEACTPLKERRRVDQDLYREKRDDMKTDSKRGPMNTLRILLERCDKAPPTVMPKTPKRRSTSLSNLPTVLEESDNSMLDSTSGTSNFNGDDSSDDDTSWNDSLECLEFPNRPCSRLSLGDDLNELEEKAVKVEDGVENEGQMEVLEDAPFSSSATESEEEEGFEFKKGDAVLAKLGKWPYWPAFVVPFHDKYRTSKKF